MSAVTQYLKATSYLHGYSSCSNLDILLISTNVAQANSRGANDPLA